jgi:hypothetical protein
MAIMQFPIGLKIEKSISLPKKGVRYGIGRFGAAFQVLDTAFLVAIGGSSFR